MFSSFLISFLLTVAVEVSIALVIFRKRDKLKVAVFIFLINLITQPLANLLFNFFNFNFYLLELGVFIVEAMLITLLFEVTFKKGVIISILINLPTALLSFAFSIPLIRAILS